jgi:hypothetical protein
MSRYIDNDKEKHERIYYASREVLGNSAENVSTADLEEFNSYLVEREDTEYAVAEAHDTFPPQKWIDESRLLQNRANDELRNRRSEK